MSIQKKFEDILANKDFDQLSSYTEPSSWKPMTQDERELLAILFVKQGEQQLIHSDSSAAESFKLASQIAPRSPAIFFYQALAYTSHDPLRQNIRCLTSAGKALEKAIQLDPSFIHAWHGWGDVLADIGAFYNDTSIFYQANEKFAEAERLSQHDRSQRPETLFWDWGRCCYKLGNLSGEAVDYFQALEKFRAATSQGMAFGEFYNDFGNLLVAIALLHGREDLFFEAAEQYQKAADHFPGQYKILLNLACTYRHLHERFGSEDIFFTADECFERASDMNRDDFDLWLAWGELYANAGKKGHDMVRLQASFAKFETANACEPDNPFVMSRWGEALMLAASYEESYELLREAEAKIAAALRGLPNSPAIWHVYGTCLIEFGYYFDSAEYYQQAVEKFMHALTLEDASPLIYHGLALAYFALGEQMSDIAMIEKSIQNYSHLAEFEDQLIPSFWNDWGVALMKLGELTDEKKHVEAAAEKFERAINSKSDEAHGENVELEWLYNYGCAMDFLGDFHEDATFYERAIHVLTHVLQIDPTYSHARYNLALALSHLGEINSDIDCFQKSLEHFEVLLQQDSEDEMAWNDWGVTLLNLAVLTHDAFNPTLSQKSYEQAEGKFLHAIALGHAYSFYNLACLYALINNTTAAMHYIERAGLSNALPSLDDLIHDEWLDNLRNLPAFRNFISQLLSKQQKDNSYE